MTYNILHIDSSPLGDYPVTRQFTAKALEGLKSKHPGAKVMTRNLGTAPLPHLSGTIELDP
jgi:FMN-dependent NADH-azoreductase